MMPWKWLFMLLLGVGGAFLWQSEEAREELFRELLLTKEFINDHAGPYEPWQIIFVSIGATLLVSSLISFLFKEEATLWARLKGTFFHWMRKIPFVKAKIAKKVNEALSVVEKDLLTPKLGEKHRLHLPKKGLSRDEVMRAVAGLERLGEVKWKEGWVSGALYNCSPELTALSTEVYGKFAWTNPLHLDVFPYIRKMEAEVVQWCVNIFNGGSNACGTMTSGGTESILMAMKAYRQVGYERGIKYPEMVCPDSCHVAFDKAAEYFRMKITRVPVNPTTLKVNMKAMARAISKNTVVLVGSAPPFPHGIIDPIEDIAKLACKYGVGVHVDCCLGGFIVPFMDRAGFKVDPFDFRVKGVTSISADTHKYGFSPKGTSVIMYANRELRHHQYFVATNWSGGLYATPVIAGSRPGGLIAATWSTMMYMGEDGYVEATKKIVETTRRITGEIKRIPGLFVFGDPKCSVVAFGSNDFDVYRLNSAMKDKGWSLNPLQFPPGVHLCVTMLHTQWGVANRFINDIRECTAELMKTPKAKATGEAAIYGMAQGIPDRSIVADFACGFIDIAYQASPPTHE